MGTILLTWNPGKEGQDTYAASDEWPEVVLANAHGRGYSWSWSVGRRRNGIGPGDTAYFLLQGSGPRGLVAKAEVRSVPERDVSYEDPTKWLNYVHVEILESVFPDECVPTELLMALVPGVNWSAIYQSGQPVDDTNASLLAEIWSKRQVAGTGALGVGEEAVYVEGAVVEVLVNRYERDPAARAACLAHYGSSCSACGLDPAFEYGELGSRVLVVHHLTPISEHKRLHAVDPVLDMRPLCANCHAMVHSEDPPLHPDALRKRLARR